MSIRENNDQKAVRYEQCSLTSGWGHNAENRSTDKHNGVSSPSQRSARYEKCSLTFDTEFTLR